MKFLIGKVFDLFGFQSPPRRGSGVGRSENQTKRENPVINTSLKGGVLKGQETTHAFGLAETLGFPFRLYLQKKILLFLY